MTTGSPYSWRSYGNSISVAPVNVVSMDDGSLALSSGLFPSGKSYAQRIQLGAEKLAAESLRDADSLTIDNVQEVQRLMSKFDDVTELHLPIPKTNKVKEELCLCSANLWK